jgi:hypothetical protein
MVGTLVEGPGLRRAASGVLHVVASTVSGAAGGLALAIAAGLLRLSAPARLGAVGVIAVLYGAMEVGVVSLPLPQTGRQVPSSWRYRFPHAVTVTLYGGLLAFGIGTRVASAGYVAILGAAALLGGPALGAAVLGTYGLCRALAVVIVANAGERDPESRVLWGFELAPLWRFLSIVQTFGLAGAAMGALLAAAR